MPEKVNDRFEEPVYVTRAFMPPFEEYMELMRGVWDRGYVTNHGPLVQEFERALGERFGLPGSVFIVNGTIALHLAIRALELKGDVITTAFSHPVTTTSIMWEGCTPVFVDVDPGTFCIDPARIEERITPRTTGIVATHVYGIPCDVEAIADIARRYGLKVLYDGAHAFGTTLNGRSILEHGDVSTTSYHATKIFHTVEGGSMHAGDPDLQRRLVLMRTMGQWGEEFFIPGMNAKNSEMHAAMGVANLKYYDAIMAARRSQWEYYHELLQGGPLGLARVPEGIGYNHAYFPVVFPSSEVLEHARRVLNAGNVFPRRYFRPACTQLPYVSRQGECPIAEGMADTVMCLPLFHDLDRSTAERIVEMLLGALKG
ncbi:MAG: DegT/DnrJ/EryC1/StrS family aminotransferase [Flavobacteriales bacterium]|nr:DegT/DnrJ/EryC1/StrS family aminotransferase [Flavobacteriales bacterium]MCB9166324.1 DegT/DnrJ/EryC1/StrS family aminotransferase [Flavobacteriales bacterium]MCB9170797.1 DegT/DnrJ/EryC1/StrS family aminotransferase [Flavobacteriales bacterium]MCB9193641.1 DegT/DnrJ/EryC1/StrS family aminotransferase [Flavobacteriales bacterium]